MSPARLSTRCGARRRNLLQHRTELQPCPTRCSTAATLQHHPQRCSTAQRCNPAQHVAALRPRCNTTHSVAAPHAASAPSGAVGCPSAHRRSRLQRRRHWQRRRWRRRRWQQWRRLLPSVSRGRGRSASGRRQRRATCRGTGTRPARCYYLSIAHSHVLSHTPGSGVLPGTRPARGGANWCMLDDALSHYGTMHAVCGVLHVGRCTLHVACCTLHVAWGKTHARCIAQATCNGTWCTLHGNVERCTVYGQRMLSIASWRILQTLIASANAFVSSPKGNTWESHSGLDWFDRLAPTAQCATICPTSAPGLAESAPHLRRDSPNLPHICAGTRPSHSFGASAQVCHSGPAGAPISLIRRAVCGRTGVHGILKRLCA